MKNIFFMIPAMRGGGAERVISSISDYFVKQGHKVTLVLFKENIVEYDLNPDVVIDTSLIGKCNNPVSRLAAFRKYMKKIGDAYVVSFFTVIGLYILAASLGLKCKVVISERLDPAQSMPKKAYLFKLREILYKYAAGFVFQTPDAEAYFDKKILKHSIIIANPLKKGLPDAYHGERDNRIVTFARLEPQKNYPMLIEAFAKFLKQKPDFILEIYGQGTMEQKLKDLVKEKNIADKVHFMGFQNALHDKIKTARLFVLPSDYEGLSNSMLEAMALGLPCVCTDCPPGGARMFINDGENGFLTPVGDRDRLCEIMLQNVDNVQLLDKVSVEAEKVRDELTVEKISQNWLDFFDTL